MSLCLLLSVILTLQIYMLKVFITSTITIPLLEKPPVTIFPSNKQGFNHYLEPSNHNHHCMTWSSV